MRDGACCDHHRRCLLRGLRVVAAIVWILFAAMPHRWSIARLVERHERVVRLGFWRPKPQGRNFVQVEEDIAGRVKAMAKGLAATRDAERLVGLTAGLPHNSRPW